MKLLRVPNGRDVLFLHIPHTAGNWILQTLTSLGFDASEIRMHHKHYLLPHLRMNHSSCMKVAFVREPISFYETIWTRIGLRSMREYLRRALRGRNKTTWHPFRVPASVWKVDFGEWVDLMVEKHPGWLSNLYELYVGPPSGEWCDYIGRKETVTTDLFALLHHVGYDCWERFDEFKDKVINPTSNIPMVDIAKPLEWTDDLKQRIKKSEYRAYRRFYHPKTAQQRFYHMSFERP